jgi:DNA-binding response OmpR family regulator
MTTDAESILVIEDEKRVAQLIARTLSTAGFDVQVAADGLRGLMLAREGAASLVILDLKLPDADGRSILTHIHETDPARQVMVLSALGDVHSRVSCFELGACDYLTKPFDVAELIARVRLRLRERRRIHGLGVLQSDGYELDLQRRTVRTHAGVRSLSTREFVLLEYLMRRSGQVCARDELLEHVWGYTFVPDTNVLDVYVARLRQKLSGNCIQTVRNVGYSFVGA